MTGSTSRRRLLRAAVLLAGPGSRAGAARAQADRPIRIVVPFVPGGGNDVFARQLAKGLSLLRNQAVVVDNKPGAGGNVGTGEVIRSAPDGHTLLLGHSGTVSINPVLYKGLKFDARSGLQPVAMLAQSALVLVVPESVPFTDLNGLISAARASSGGWNFASSGTGTGGHLTGEMFRMATGLTLQHIPYKGTAPALGDVAGGQVQMSFSVLPPALALIRAGKLRAIAVTSARRLPSLPQVPTVMEAGIAALSAFESSVTYGVLAPAGTPQAMVRDLSRDILKVVAAAPFQERLDTEGAIATPGDAALYARIIRAENEKWAGVVMRSGASAE